MKNTRKKKSSLHAMLFLGGASLFFLFGFYVFQINHLTMLAYNTKSEEAKLTTLADESSSLETLHQENYAFQKFPTLAQTLNFVKTGTVSYVQVLEGTVAKQ
ncbi:MAG: hypothetical protein A3A27_01075 [Candidatus Wildermuthbacteria bacterium RIFCSPLOWO2_01_FULL_47_18]|uniref:Uncharacterized protein n=1 Tax=Candidatus Wildermuthbacteria bacterium RIFCSPLOWO2_01_FULL_47_18 TaxID=1802460 RepID=A0A1G2RIJ2_9BACT|nr:MAG: hypothetical protein A3A27_01075 [Candidatus Wildermuthbacteria bacterium RIFCSPLOWO2_01_FULL_47_18]